MSLPVVMIGIGHAAQCGERWAASKNLSQLKQASTPCTDEQHLKKEAFEVVGELASVCAQILL